MVAVVIVVVVKVVEVVVVQLSLSPWWLVLGISVIVRRRSSSTVV